MSCFSKSNNCLHGDCFYMPQLFLSLVVLSQCRPKGKVHKWNSVAWHPTCDCWLVCILSIVSEPLTSRKRVCHIIILNSLYHACVDTCIHTDRHHPLASFSRYHGKRRPLALLSVIKGEHAVIISQVDLGRTPGSNSWVLFFWPDRREDTNSVPILESEPNLTTLNS